MRECEACAAWAARLLLLDDELAAAAAVRVPEGLGERIILWMRARARSSSARA